MDLTPEQESLLRDLPPEQQSLVLVCWEKAEAIAQLRRDISDLAAERRVLVGQLQDLIGDVAKTAAALQISRQTLAGIVGSSRRPAGPPLLPLLRQGVLLEDEPLIIVRRKERSLEAWVNVDGAIRIGPEQDAPSFTTPSRAAGALMNAKSADGWLRFRVPRLDGRTLDEIRRLAAQG